MQWTDVWMEGIIIGLISEIVIETKDILNLVEISQTVSTRLVVEARFLDDDMMVPVFSPNEEIFVGDYVVQVINWGAINWKDSVQPTII